MSFFRDVLDADAEDVFLDLDAFADEHTFNRLNGKKMMFQRYGKNAARSGSSRRRIIWQNSRWRRGA